MHLTNMIYAVIARIAFFLLLHLKFKDKICVHVVCVLNQPISFQISWQHADRGVTCFDSFQNMKHEDLAECIYIKVIHYAIEIPQGECKLRI